MRFNDDTTVRDLYLALAPKLQRLLDRDEMTGGQECLAAVTDFANEYPESQTAADLLAWAHGSTPGACVENARAENIEAWVAPEDRAAYEAYAAQHAD